eukprot:1207059-Pleurochrysis_carterae.AAC.1
MRTRAHTHARTLARTYALTHALTHARTHLGPYALIHTSERKCPTRSPSRLRRYTRASACAFPVALYPACALLTC